MLHNRVIRRVVERQQPAFDIFMLSILRCPVDDLLRNARERVTFCYVHGPGIRCILNVMLKAGLDCCEFLHYHFEAILAGFFQVDARKVKVSQSMFDRAAAGLAGIGGQGLADMGIGALQSLVL